MRILSQVTRLSKTVSQLKAGLLVDDDVAFCLYSVCLEIVHEEHHHHHRLPRLGMHTLFFFSCSKEDIKHEI